jgi:hypothetical protein
MIYCIWYPSGGFGHFINAVLTLHGNNFVRPNQSLEFSSTGDSHSLDLVVPKYFHNSWPGGIEFIENKNYCVLIDNGINDESTGFKSTFPNSTVIKICYSDRSWPIVARTMIDKAMKSSIEKQLSIDAWETDKPWARREKYFLYLRDHQLRHAWKHTTGPALYVDDMLSYKNMFDLLNSIMQVDAFDTPWTEWQEANAQYIDPVKVAQDVMALVEYKQSKDLGYITDIWTQAVVYYYIWIMYGIEVPHNDFADFFSNSEQIMELVA